MTKFSKKLKKTGFGPFWALFPNVGAKKNFSQKIWLSRTTSYKFLASCQISEKTNDTIPRKCLVIRWEDGQTLLYRTLPATAGGPKTD